MIWEWLCAFTFGHWWRLAPAKNKLPGWECKVCGVYEDGVIARLLVP